MTNSKSAKMNRQLAQENRMVAVGERLRSQYPDLYIYDQIVAPGDERKLFVFDTRNHRISALPYDTLAVASLRVTPSTTEPDAPTDGNTIHPETPRGFVVDGAKIEAIVDRIHELPNADELAAIDAIRTQRKLMLTESWGDRTAVKLDGGGRLDFESDEGDELFYTRANAFARLMPHLVDERNAIGMNFKEKADLKIGEGQELTTTQALLAIVGLGLDLSTLPLKGTDAAITLWNQRVKDTVFVYARGEEIKPRLDGDGEKIVAYVNADGETVTPHFVTTIDISNATPHADDSVAEPVDGRVVRIAMPRVTGLYYALTCRLVGHEALSKPFLDMHFVGGDSMNAAVIATREPIPIDDIAVKAHLDWPTLNVNIRQKTMEGSDDDIHQEEADQYAPYLNQRYMNPVVVLRTADDERQFNFLFASTNAEVAAVSNCLSAVGVQDATTATNAVDFKKFMKKLIPATKILAAYAVGRSTKKKTAVACPTRSKKQPRAEASPAGATDTTTTGTTAGLDAAEIGYIATTVRELNKKFDETLKADDDQGLGGGHLFKRVKRTDTRVEQIRNNVNSLATALEKLTNVLVKKGVIDNDDDSDEEEEDDEEGDGQ